jgi:hypothetical protein
MPIDQTIRGLALEIDASVDPAPEAQPLLEYRFINLASTQTILARIKGIARPDGGGQLAFETNAGADITTQRMLIDDKGKVGIGTGNPEAKLDVVGDARFSGTLSVQGALTVSGAAKIGGDLSVTGKLEITGDAKFNGPLEVEGTLTVNGAARTDAIGVGGHGRTGQIGIDDANGKNTIMIGGPQGAGRIGLGGNNSRGQVAIFDENTNFTINLGGIDGAARIGLGGNGSIGTIDFFDASANHTIRIGSAQGPGRIGLGGNGSDGVIDVFDANSNQTIKINGKTGNVEVTGDIRLSSADCAEEFDICETEQTKPGTVMVLGEGGKLEQSQKAYDKRVAGVISGAGNYKPGIVLDKRQSDNIRQPIALLGKVYCKVDAQYGAIEVGDLLTTSLTPGMR